MPELPEVETFVREIRPRLIARRFISARLSHDDVLRGVTRRRLLAGLKGARVKDVFRRAKHVVIVTDRGRLVVQPGMTGSLVVGRSGGRETGRQGEEEAEKYRVLQVALSGGDELVYRDPRRLGTLLWLADRAWKDYDAALGPEPLAEEFSPAGLGRILAGSRSAVKKVLMDQHALAGVGNIYAQEALFAARIDPSKPANQVPARAVAPLYRALRRILHRAILAQGSSIRDYRTGSGRRGGFQLELRVYGREGRRCVRCGTTLAGTHAIDGRITVFCHHCQH